MDIEIRTEPLEFNLYGKGGLVENHQYAETGQNLMAEMKEKMTAGGLSPKTVLHWVYDSTASMFVGMDFEDEATARNLFEHKSFKLEKYVYYRYTGSYDGIGKIHQGLEKEMSARGIVEIGPRVEKYVDMSGDPASYVTEFYVGIG